MPASIARRLGSMCERSAYLLPFSAGPLRSCFNSVASACQNGSHHRAELWESSHSRLQRWQLGKAHTCPENTWESLRITQILRTSSARCRRSGFGRLPKWPIYAVGQFQMVHNYRMYTQPSPDNWLRELNRLHGETILRSDPSTLREGPGVKVVRKKMD